MLYIQLFKGYIYPAVKRLYIPSCSKVIYIQLFKSHLDNTEINIAQHLQHISNIYLTIYDLKQYPFFYKLN